MSKSPVIRVGCEIRRVADGIFRDKGNGTKVRYHIFPEYEIHDNTIAPGTVQEWHHHEAIIETLVVTSGRLEARWLESDGAPTAIELNVGDLIDVGDSVHTFANMGTTPASFLVFRLVPIGKDRRGLIKNDRYSDPDPVAR
jgi:mannose-6-phosphate isomerase-like protein (cupin superfamily)